MGSCSVLFRLSLQTADNWRVTSVAFATEEISHGAYSRFHSTYSNTKSKKQLARAEEPNYEINKE